jgi:hypothetical protein
MGSNPVLLQQQKIYIVEGPAGSGKSYFASEISSTIKGGIVPPPPGFGINTNQRRSYDGLEGEVTAWVKDIYRFGMALGRAPKTALLDRFMVSSYVYNHLRRGDLPEVVDTTRFHQLVTSYIAAMTGTIVTLKSRGFFEGQRESPSFIWLFNLPPLEAIAERRAKSGKQYPFPLDAESALYSNIAAMLQSGMVVGGEWFKHVEIINE